MHEGVDFLYEAVANSLEAGARQVEVTYKSYKTEVEVLVIDDGKDDILASCFEEGISGKSNHAGLGLSLLKERTAGKVKLDRIGNSTKLWYLIKKDQNYGHLSSVLPLIFAMLENQTLKFTYIKDEMIQVIDSQAFSTLYETSSIIHIRNLVQSWD